MDWTIVFIALGALAGGFVNGMTGFGTALTAMPFWLLVASPITAAQLAAACGAFGQVLTISSVRHSVRFSHVGPITIAGLVGMPIGVWMLPRVSADDFKLGFGVLLIAYCTFMLFANGRVRLTRRRPIADLWIGVAGGVTAGVAGLSGAFPTMWAAVHDWSKDDKRALIQVFNFVILTATLVATLIAGLLTWPVVWAILVALPGTFIGAKLGVWTYARLDDRRFDRVVLGVLWLSGLVMMASRW